MTTSTATVANTNIPNPKLGPQYQTWLNLLCRNFVARVRLIPEVVMVSVQPYNDSGLPDFFVLLDDSEPAEQSSARFRVTSAVLGLRWQYANPWLLDYYFLNLQDYREENATVSWREFVSPSETIIYVRDGQPIDMRLVRWAGTVAGMASCTVVGLLIAAGNHTSPGNLLKAGLPAMLFLLPLVLVAGWLTRCCTERAFGRGNLWSNGENFNSSWMEALVESGIATGSITALLALIPINSGFSLDFLGDFGSNATTIHQSTFWSLPVPLDLLAYFNPSSLVAIAIGLVSGLVMGFFIATSTGWLVRRIVAANRITQDTPATEPRLVVLFRFVSLAITFMALFFACYALWPISSGGGISYYP